MGTTFLARNIPRLAFAVVGVLVLASSLGEALPARAGSVGLNGALPTQAHVLFQLSLSARTGATVVIYRDSTARLGVVALDHGKEKLLWKRQLYGRPVRLLSPDAGGSFVALTDGSGRAMRLYAFAFRAGKVTSTIVGSTRGYVTGDAGIHLTSDGFVTRNVDTQHVGSVAYRVQSQFSWDGKMYQVGNSVRVPDYPPNGVPVPNGVVKTSTGDKILMRLEVANTEAQRQTGLMNRKTLDPDSGMVFQWSSLVLESFWMENTYVPLSVAFLDPSGKIQEIQDMDPLSEELHTPQLPYEYAIEMNRGYFAANGIHVGDVVSLHLGPSKPSPTR